MENQISWWKCLLKQMYRVLCVRWSSQAVLLAVWFTNADSWPDLVSQLSVCLYTADSSDTTFLFLHCCGLICISWVSCLQLYTCCVTQQRGEICWETLTFRFRTSPKCQFAAEQYHLFVIFAVLDVSLAVNLCINCSFLHLFLQFYYISELLQQNCLFGLPSRTIRPNRNWSC